MLRAPSDQAPRSGRRGPCAARWPACRHVPERSSAISGAASSTSTIAPPWPRRPTAPGDSSSTIRHHSSTHDRDEEVQPGAHRGPRLRQRARRVVDVDRPAAGRGGATTTPDQHDVERHQHGSRQHPAGARRRAAACTPDDARSRSAPRAISVPDEAERPAEHALRASVRRAARAQRLHAELERLEVHDVEQRDVGNQRGQEGVGDDLRVGDPTYSTMRKAAAPITGGMIWPLTELRGLDRARLCRAKPTFFISGIVKVPPVTTFLIDEPEIMPVIADATRAAFSGPPRRWPSARSET